MQRRLCFSLLAAAMVVAALGGIPDRASAAIRVTITDSVNTKVFYSPDEASGVFTTFGDYEVFLFTAITNYPGDGTGGMLSQNLTLSDTSGGTGTLNTLFVTTDIIEDVGSLGSGEVTGDNLTAVNSASLALFTQPSGTSLSVTSSIGSTGGGGGATGTLANNIDVNGSLTSSSTPVGSAVIDSETGTAVNSGGYTLSSEIVLSGANAGISGLAISASANVALAEDAEEVIPEPGSLAVLGLGAVGLAVTALRRRRQTST